MESCSRAVYRPVSLYLHDWCASLYRYDWCASLYRPVSLYHHNWCAIGARHCTGTSGARHCTGTANVQNLLEAAPKKSDLLSVVKIVTKAPKAPTYWSPW